MRVKLPSLFKIAAAALILSGAALAQGVLQQPGQAPTPQPAPQPNRAPFSQNPTTGAITANFPLTLNNGGAFNLNAATPPTFGFPVEATGADAAGPDAVSSTGFGINGAFVGVRADGTGAAPTAVQSGEIIAVHGSGGRGATGWFLGTGGLAVRAGENWSDTAQGTEATIDTTTPTTTGGATARLGVNLGVVTKLAGVNATGGYKGDGSLNLAAPLYVNNNQVTDSSGKLIATATNNNAAAGIIGEYVTNSASSIALTNGVAATIASISLTAGDWEVWGNVLFVPAAGTTVSGLGVGSNTVAATMPPTGDLSRQDLTLTYQTGVGQALSVGRNRYLLSGPATVYLVCIQTFGVSTMTGGGNISARRMR